MFNRPAVFVDIETNGGSGARGRITEIAMIRVEDGKIVDEFTSLINPGSDIPYWITKLTGITTSDVMDAPYFQDIAAEVARISQDAIFVAHNVRFDYSFIKREMAQAGYSYAPPLFCTVRMSRALYPTHQGHSLEKIIARHNITVENRHRAKADAMAMYDFVQLSITNLGLDAFTENVASQSKTRSLPPNVAPAIIADLPESPGVYIFEDDTGAPLYVGKSINIRTRVRSHFANDTSIAKEMKLSLTTHHISYIQTDTEIEALLLESAKIKELQPVHNRLLRRKTTQSVFEKIITKEGYSSVVIKNRDLSSADSLDNIYGVYTTKRQAKATLEEIAKTYQLCPQLLGLETGSGACFRYQLGLCKGACIGKESVDKYNARFEFALEKTRIQSWPFKSRIALELSPVKSLIVYQWVIEGIITHEFEPNIEPIEGGFDIDTYKILRSYIRNKKPRISEYSAKSFEQW